MLPKKKKDLQLFAPIIVSIIICIVGFILGISDFLYGIGGWVAQAFFTIVWGGLLCLNMFLGICLFLLTRKKTTDFWVNSLWVITILLLLLSLLIGGYMGLGIYTALMDI